MSEQEKTRVSRWKGAVGWISTAILGLFFVGMFALSLGTAIFCWPVVDPSVCQGVRSMWIGIGALLCTITLFAAARFWGPFSSGVNHER